jgi:hypothetical protein
MSQHLKIVKCSTEIARFQYLYNTIVQRQCPSRPVDILFIIEKDDRICENMGLLKRKISHGLAAARGKNARFALVHKSQNTTRLLVPFTVRHDFFGF